MSFIEINTYIVNQKLNTRHAKPYNTEYEPLIVGKKAKQWKELIQQPNVKNAKYTAVRQVMLIDIQ